MRFIRPSSLPFNTTPLGSWASIQAFKRHDRAVVKLAKRAGISLPVAQTIADLNGLGDRGRW